MDTGARRRYTQLVEKAIANPSRIAPYLFVKAQQTIGRRWNYGFRPYREEWDVLIVLDACRFDLFQEVVADHEISAKLSSIEPVYSCASATREWVERTLDAAPDSYLEDLFVVAGTGHIDAHCDTNRFGGYAPLWKYEHESKLTLPPDLITNEALKSYREFDPERLYVHYIQPHAPFLHCIDKYNALNSTNKTQVWDELRDGNITKQEVWADYAENLRTVLDHALTLIENTDGTVLITSDHGNLLGEFGLYGHPPYLLVPALKRVPLAIAEGEGKSTYTVKDIDDFEEYQRTTLRDHLHHLGYVD